MIRTRIKDGAYTFEDESEALSPQMLAAVHAAMESGLTEFTTPTPEPDDKRIDWRVRRWVIPGEKPRSFLVAYQEMNAHFEILGPEADLGASPKKLQTRER